MCKRGTLVLCTPPLLHRPTIIKWVVTCRACFENLNEHHYSANSVKPVSSNGSFDQVKSRHEVHPSTSRRDGD